MSMKQLASAHIRVYQKDGEAKLSEIELTALSDYLESCAFDSLLRRDMASAPEIKARVKIVVTYGG